MAHDLILYKDDEDQHLRIHLSGSTLVFISRELQVRGLASRMIDKPVLSCEIGLLEEAIRQLRDNGKDLPHEPKRSDQLTALKGKGIEIDQVKGGE